MFIQYIYNTHHKDKFTYNCVFPFTLNAVPLLLKFTLPSVSKLGEARRLLLFQHKRIEGHNRQLKGGQILDRHYVHRNTTHDYGMMK